MALGDTTHTVVVQSDNRGKYFIIGLGILILFVYWLFSGHMFRLTSFLAQVSLKQDILHIDGRSMSPREGVTGTVLPMMLQGFIWLCIVVGFAFTKFWAGVWDVISGVIDTAKLFAAQYQARSAATNAANTMAVTTGQAVAKKRAVDTAKLAAALEIIAAKVDRLSNIVDPPPPSPEEQLRMDLAKATATIEAMQKQYNIPVPVITETPANAS